MAKITDQQIMNVIHDNTKSRKDREREAVEMVRQQQREAEDNRNRKHVERITQ